MGHVTHRAEAAAPSECAFEYFSDYRNVPKWLLGAEKFEPTGEQTRGVGATFDVLVDVGPFKIKAVVDFTEWVEGERVALHGVAKGLEIVGTWFYRPLEAERCYTEADFTYSVGKGLAAKALDRVLYAFAKLAVKHVDKHLTAQIEQAWAERKASAG